jgi:hypothetical protein
VTTKTKPASRRSAPAYFKPLSYYGHLYLYQLVDWRDADHIGSDYGLKQLAGK